MKTVERERARELRRAGWAVKAIAREVGAAVGSVSLWVRDIELTEEQQRELLKRNPHEATSKVLITRFRNARQKYQEQGRAMAREMNPLHMAGCMLYWAEGAKKKGCVKLVNSDVYLMRFFLKFLRVCYFVPNEKIKICIYCYTDSGLTVDEIEAYWIEQLELSYSNLRKGQVNNYSRSSSGKRKGKLKHGVCHLAVDSTELAQNIFGAIQEYGEFTNPLWLG